MGIPGLIRGFGSLSSRNIHIILLLLIFFGSLYLRIALPLPNLYRDGRLDISGDPDSWYHYRLLESTIRYFPFRMEYDPFNYYPHGSNFLHFGKLFTQIEAGISLLISGGVPDDDIARAVHSIMPGIYGSLLVFPAYLIGAILFGRREGLIAAALTVLMPGQLLTRSVLGVGDHHVVEVLLSGMIIALVLICLERARKLGYTFKHLLDLSKFSNFSIYPLVTGFVIAVYTFIYPGAIFFSLLLLVFTLFQCIYSHLRSEDLNPLCLTITSIFGFASLAVIPGADWIFVRDMPSLSQIYGYAASAAFPLVLLMLSWIWNRLRFPKGSYILGISLILAASSLLPENPMMSFVGLIVGSIYRVGGALTIAEGAPLLSRGFEMAWGNFGFLFYISFISLGILIAEQFRSWNQNRLLFILWCLAYAILALAQNRFAYYYAISVALLGAFFIQKLARGISRWIFPLRASDRRLAAPLGFCGILMLIVSPTLGITLSHARFVGPFNPDWIEALSWLGKNTPDPGLDYYYPYPALEPGTKFQYPPQSYGVISWWDYGHYIDQISRRPANANPFQQGIGGPQQGYSPGAAWFFTNLSEDEASKIADELRVKYVVTDIEMATGKFYAMATWAFGDLAKAGEFFYTPVRRPDGRIESIPNSNFWRTMESRMHFLDGSQTQIPTPQGMITVEALTRYRLIHESPQTALALDLDGDGIREHQAKYVKIFEYVKGALIHGRAPPGEKISLELKLRTGQGREFSYLQTTISNGSYHFRVPYATGPPTQGTNYDVRSLGPYIITSGGISKQLEISDRDVVQGSIFQVDLYG